MVYPLGILLLAAVASAKCKPDSNTATSSASLDAAVQSLYGQCGGQNWSGPTACATGSVCNPWNPFYHQCIVGQTTFASAVASAAKETSSLALFSSQTPAATSVSQGEPSVISSDPAHVSSSITQVTTSSSEAAISRQPSSVTRDPTSVSIASQASSATAIPAASSSSASTDSGNGTVYKASFTQYGSTDTWGSGTCNTNTAACGFYSNPGYNAAVSQNFFGVGPGSGAGPGCGTCWALTPSTDSSGNALSGASSIVVKINNLCPADGNPLCAQSGTTGTNQYGANVNFDLCIDDGANTALFGSSSVGLAVGTAKEVDCEEWKGTDIRKRMTI